MKKHFIHLLFCLPFYVTAQQVVEQGKLHVAALAADEMHGRGYVNDGYNKAVTYVEEQFKKHKIKSFGKTYRQAFTYPVNTFPDSVVLQCGNNVLKPGKDYIVSPSSGSDKGSYKPVYFTLEKLFVAEKYLLQPGQIAVVLPYKKLSKDSLAKARKQIEMLNANGPVMRLTTAKLTWSVSDEVLPHANVEVNYSAFDTTVQNIRLNIHNKLIEAFQSYNVVGYIPAKRKKCKTYMVVTAHLDHLGMMGNTATFNGANDNASGVAFMLTLMEHYAKNPPAVNMVFMAFGGEEAGLIGSHYFVDNPLFDLKNISFLLNVDLMGTGEDGITAVNATKFEKQFQCLKDVNGKQNYLSNIKSRGEAANSDHYWFTQKGVPCFFIYTMGGTIAYHDIFDRAEQLPLTKFNALHNLAIDFFNALVKLKH